MRIIFLIVGDFLVLYLSLFAALVVRYGGNFYERFVSEHFVPFSIIFVIWLIVFYVSGLYDSRRLRNNMDFLKTLWLAIGVNAVMAMLFFYLIPYFVITPKTNLFVFIIIFAALEITWRRSFNKFTAQFQAKTKLAIVGSGQAVEEISAFVKENSQLGYELALWLKNKEDFSPLKEIIDWEKLVIKNKIDLIVIPRYFKNEPEAAKIFYRLLTLGVNVVDLPTFYEIIFQKIPLEEVNEEWFLDEIVEKEKFYDNLKRGIELIVAFVLGVLLLPVEILITFIVKISSPGPAIYKQTRVGRNRKEFTIYKFRTMKMNEAHEWPEENDKRITAVGGFLRKTHLDELPQLLNIIKGDVSFVGPRPDFLDFYDNLEKTIPYYSIRTLVRPGVTGWAQTKYPITASIEQTKERLAYDLYYIKNRSVALDIAIIAKTVKVLLTAQGR
ncbi:MAG: sugar transferase [Patescibacteria group bacterium]